MGGVFINYRSGPHFPSVLVLHLLLEKHLGKGRVFLDLPEIPYGSSYSDTLRQKVSECDVFIAVIHSTWATDADPVRGRYLDQPDDWVRREIRQALAEGKTVIPVLLADLDPDARMPTAGQLPADLAPLALRQGAIVHRKTFVADLDRVLMETARNVTGWQAPPDDPPERKRRRWWAVPLAVLGCLLGVGAAVAEVAVGGDAALLAVWLTALLAAPAIAVTIVTLGRGLIATFEGLAHKLSPRRYVVFATPILIGPLTFMLTAFPAGEPGPVNMFALPLAIMVFLAVGIALGIHVLRGEERERQWPPVRGPRSYPASIRRDLVRLRERLGEWERPLTADRAAQTDWLLRQIEHRVDDVADLAAQSRFRWALAEYPKSTASYLAFLGAITGCCAAFLVTRPTPMAVAVLLSAYALTAVAVELHYRNIRAGRLALVREMRGGSLGEAREALADARRFTL